MATAKTVTGVVQKVRRDGKGFTLDVTGEDVWYSAYVAAETNGAGRGDNVTVKYTEKGDYKNIAKEGGVVINSKGATQSGGSGGGKSGGGGKEFRSVPELTRIDGLQFAIEFVNGANPEGGLGDRLKKVLKAADVFVSYVEGAFSNGPSAAPETTSDPDAEAAAAAAAAKAAAEAEAERRRIEAEQIAAQKAQASSALDSFLAD